MNTAAERGCGGMGEGLSGLFGLSCTMRVLMRMDRSSLLEKASPWATELAPAACQTVPRAVRP